jgi:formate hydrogenlyase transcriptional activator
MDRDPLSAAERALIDTAVALTAGFDIDRICQSVLDAVERMYEARSSWILLHDASTDELSTCAVRGSGADAFAQARVPVDKGIVGLAFSKGEPVFVPDVDAEMRWYNKSRVQSADLATALVVPLTFEQKPVGVLGLDSPHFSSDRPPTPGDLARLQGMAAQTAVAIQNARLVDNIEQDRRRLRRLLQERRQLRQEVVHLRDTVRDVQALSAMVGESPLWKAVLDQVELVAPADSTVLLIGETGTGKELIARAIHEQGRRRRQAFVAVNCAAFPESLVESELFGHERGAFTGAFERKPGKFELADRGTLFLDEIGELPAGVQAKLLRVLQEREVTRIGASKPTRVNVRLVAATNRDLQEALRSGSFRQDLFYRLSVFPITLPPLRDRVDDIAALARFFVQRFAERQGRARPQISESALRALQEYHWPGNVRELQNVLERAVILARAGVITPDLLVLEGSAAEPPAPADKPVAPRFVSTEHAPSNVISFSEAERRAIVRALEMTGWRISGRGGAADLLGLKPTTLHAKMKRLGVHRPRPGIEQDPPPAAS